MNWLTNFVRPRIKAALMGRREVPDDLWRKCPACGDMLFHRDLKANHHVCGGCGHHIRLPARDRLDLLFGGVWEAIPMPEVRQDPLGFRDRRRYTDRLRDARAAVSRRGIPGANDAVVAARGAIGGSPAVAVVMDFSFMGGSMGAAVGAGIVAAARAAVETRAALVAVTASGGARMQESVLSLMQLPRTVIAMQHVRDAGLPRVVVLTDPTTGGVSASFAMLGDIHIAEPGAMIGFAGRRVIEQTVREVLPDGFQTAEYLLEHGMVDMVTPRAELRETLGRVLGLLGGGAARADGPAKAPPTDIADGREPAAPLIPPVVDAVPPPAP